ncbi:hypothetical protein ACH47B_13335 [Rhodococcus sp. NPDC019627]|uniref:hypothetical protein n=1 Tax=unclassified Rhodococcus (in: high G+C Gram-positive bacteria) TaxID=192944 RepID=UPI00340C246B
MAFAELSDVATRLGRALTADEAAEAPGLLDEASALVEGYCNQDFDPVPSTVRLVTSRIAARALTTPTTQDSAAVSSEQFTAGPFTVNRSFVGDGSATWIGATEKTMLRRFRISMRSVPSASDRQVAG